MKRLTGTAGRAEEADQDCEGGSRTGEAAGGIRGKGAPFLGASVLVSGKPGQKFRELAGQPSGKGGHPSSELTRASRFFRASAAHLLTLKYCSREPVWHWALPRLSVKQHDYPTATSPGL